MVASHQVWEKLEEERHDEQANVHTIYVRIGGYYYIVIAQSFQPFFYIQCVLQQVELLILIHYFFSQAIGVKGLTAEAENCLAFHLPAFGDRSAGTVAFGNKYGTLLLFQIVFVPVLCRWFIVQMYTAVAQLFIVQVRFFRAFICQLTYAAQFFAFAFALLDTFFQRIGNGGILMQVVIELFIQEVANERLHRRTIFPHILRTQLSLGLRFKYRLLHPYRYCCAYALTYIRSIIVFFVKLADGLYECFAESSLVGTTLGSMLAIHE